MLIEYIYHMYCTMRNIKHVMHMLFYRYEFHLDEQMDNTAELYVDHE